MTYSGTPCVMYFVNFPLNDKSHMQLVSWTSTVRTSAGKKRLLLKGIKNILQQLHFSSRNYLFSFFYLWDTNISMFQDPYTDLAARVVLLLRDWIRRFPRHLSSPSHLYLNQSTLWKIWPLGCTSASRQREASPSVQPPPAGEQCQQVHLLECPAWSQPLCYGHVSQNQATGYIEGFRAKLTPWNKSRGICVMYPSHHTLN